MNKLFKLSRTVILISILIAAIFIIISFHLAKFGFVFPWRDDRESVKEIKKKALNAKIIVLCAGDSITAASYPDYLQQKFNNLRDDVLIINKGIPGNTSGEYLRFLKSSKILDETNPDFVLLQLGTNDVRIDSDHTSVSDFYKNMQEIINIMQSHRNPRGNHSFVLLATIPPVVVNVPFRFNDDSKRRVVEEINPAIISLAKEKGIPVLNNYKLFRDNPAWLPEIHPNDEGYRAMADNWFNFLLPFISKIP